MLSSSRMLPVSAGACFQATLRSFACKPALLVALALLPLAAFAQSVRWEPASGQLGFNQVTPLALVFEDCEPEEEPNLPRIDGLNFVGQPSRSSETSMVNFKTTRRFSLIYPTRPTTRNPLTIPEFTVKTDKGALRVAAARFTVGDAPVGNSGLSINDISSVALEVPKPSVWAGEVFPVTYTLEVVRRYFHSFGSNVEWPSTPLVADDWSKPEPSEVLLRGERRVLSTQTTQAYAKNPGIFTLNPASQLVNLIVGASGFSFFSQPAVEQRQLDSNPLELTVKPLPAAPPEFSGAVGEFSFVSKVVPTNATVGEPVTWTLELSGKGNWPDITGLPQREASNDFQVVQPKSKRTMKEGTLFEGVLSEDVVLVPTKPGIYRLAPVRFSYFDPKSGTYKTVSSEPVTVTIAAATAPAQAPAPAGAPLQFSLNTPAASAATSQPTGVAPVPPENLPRDPLEGKATGFIPFRLDRLVAACIAVAAIVPLLVWLAFAALRSRELDVERRRREARRALAVILADLRRSLNQPAALQALLRQWQTETVALWEIPHAAPGSTLVHAQVARRLPDGAGGWSRLWSEADQTLHGRDAALPPDWPMRADAALGAVKVPGWNPLSLLSPRHLLPFLFVLGLVALPVTGRGDANADAYKRGDFAAAQAAWARQVAAEPSDWIARHNLGLALAQQDRWAEATAHWTSAFVLNSRAEATRWDLALGLQRSGLAQPDLVELSRGEGRFRVARLATPGQWQLILLESALLLAAALVLLLLQGYKRIGPWGKPTALGAILLAVLIAGAATFSLHAYGQLANPSAVFVWRQSTLRSVPTDADSAQKTSPLSAGSIAVTEKTFLGWTKLSFPGGQSGWVRTEDLIPLYR